MSLSSLTLREISGGTAFAVRVQPGARRAAITGTYPMAGSSGGVALKLSLAAPAIEGRANEALIRFFAGLFRVPRASITIAGGLHSRTKSIRVAGCSTAEVQAALSTIVC
jgi:uncharacterized protein (TIGR00251 family)